LDIIGKVIDRYLVVDSEGTSTLLACELLLHLQLLLSGHSSGNGANNNKGVITREKADEEETIITPSIGLVVWILERFKHHKNLMNLFSSKALNLLLQLILKTDHQGGEDSQLVFMRLTATILTTLTKQQREQEDKDAKYSSSNSSSKAISLEKRFCESLDILMNVMHADVVERRSIFFNNLLLLNLAIKEYIATVTKTRRLEYFTTPVAELSSAAAANADDNGNDIEIKHRTLLVDGDAKKEEEEEEDLNISQKFQLINDVKFLGPNAIWKRVKNTVRLRCKKGHCTALANKGYNSGQHIWRIKWTEHNNGDPRMGVACDSHHRCKRLGASSSQKGWAINMDTTRCYLIAAGNKTEDIHRANARIGGVLDVILDCDKGNLTFRVDGKVFGNEETAFGPSFKDLDTSGTYFPAFSFNNDGEEIELLGQGHGNDGSIPDVLPEDGFSSNSKDWFNNVLTSKACIQVFTDPTRQLYFPNEFLGNVWNKMAPIVDSWEFFSPCPVANSTTIEVGSSASSSSAASSFSIFIIPDSKRTNNGNDDDDGDDDDDNGTNQDSDADVKSVQMIEKKEETEETTAAAFG